VCVIGHSDQIASTSVSRRIHSWSASVRAASPTIAIAAASSAVLIAHASAALPNSRHLREGIEAASLRHYFQTQSDLLAFAMELVVERVRGRVAALDDPELLLQQVLPLDDERRAEMQVWLAFTMRALVDPRLRELRDAAHAALRGLCRRVASDELDAERLHALVDGLALHAVLAPDVTTPERQVELLRLALQSR
jgi:transcriptional regulator BetI-like protein